jgi:hypothetical protein
MGQVEQFVTFMAACELETFIYEHEDCLVASKFINAITNILQYCITNFLDNVYIVDYNKRVMADHKSTSLLHKEENEEAIDPPKLGDVLEPPKDDSDIQTQNSIAIHKAPYTLHEGIQNLDNPSYFDAPLLPSNDTSEIIDEKECSLNMLYDTALDDGPMLIGNPTCLHEDRNDILAIHDDTLIHENPILFLKSLIRLKCIYNF